MNKVFTAYLLSAVIMLSLMSCSNSNNTIPITTASDEALEYYIEGLELAQNIRGQEALYYYSKAIGEDPEFAMAYVQLALVQTTPKLAYKYLNKAKALIDNVSDGEALIILATEAGFNGELEKQNNYLLTLIERYPNDANTHRIYGNFQYGLAKYKSAIKHLKRSLELNPALTQPYNILGYSYRQIGDYDEAEKYLLKYIEIISEDPNPYDSYAELLLKKGEFAKSIEYYRKALEIQPKFFASKIGIATNLTLMEEHDAACDELETIREETNDPGILQQMNFAKSVVNVDRRDFDQAIGFIENNISISKEIKDNLSLGNELNNLGTLYLMQGDNKKSLKYFEKSLEYFERSDISQDLKYYLRRQLFVNTGWLAYLKEDLETLKKHKEKYISSAPQALNLNEIRNVHVLGGHINMLEHDYANAIYEYNQANLENPRIVYLIGSAYENLGDYESAYENYSTAAHFNALNSLNYAYIRKIALEKLEEF